LQNEKAIDIKGLPASVAEKEGSETMRSSETVLQDLLLENARLKAALDHDDDSVHFQEDAEAPSELKSIGDTPALKQFTINN